MDKNTRIAGYKTVNDWISFRDNNLIPDLKSKNKNSADWEEAFDSFFMHRINTRYINPINQLIKMEEYNGEGFAIVSLQCALIEFLQATCEGLTYKKENPSSLNFEYNRSGALFKRFLVENLPFRTYFDSSEKASDFYNNVRCALLHEAQTRSDWKIRFDNRKDFIERRVIDPIILNEAFKLYFKKYKENFIVDRDRQKAFIRKMNGICQLPLNEGIEKL